MWKSKERDIKHLIIQLKKHLDKTRGAEVSKLSACFVEVDERNPVTITRGTRSQNSLTGAYKNSKSQDKTTNMMVECNSFKQLAFSETNMGKSPYHFHNFRTEVQKRKIEGMEVYWLMSL